MGTKFSDYLEQSRKSDGPDDAALREVFRADIILGLQFRDARAAMGLTQHELAVRSGVPQADISRIERGAANPTESTLLRLADSLNQRLELVAR
jgi:DNA-binding XRE family transcriptional regulator